MKLRWKTLNPNQKTYTKLGRPRLLPTDQIDNPELGYSSSSSTSYFSDESKSVTPTPAMPTPPSSSESSNQYFHANVIAQNTTSAVSEVFPEPIVGRDDSDEEMSSEDIVIFKAFLRGQSSGSMRLDGSFRNLLSMAEIPEEVAKNFPGMAGISGVSSRSLGRGSSISWAPIEATGEAKSQTSRSSKLVTMMSLGSVRSASLRSLTEVDPYFDGEDLTRQISGMSLLDGMGGEADGDNQVETGDVNTNHGEFIRKMDSFEDAQLIAEAMLNPVDMTKTSFTEQLNGTGGYMDNGRNNEVAGEINEALLNEFFNPETDGGSANATTVSVQDFYNGDVTLDLLSAADRFEI